MKKLLITSLLCFFMSSGAAQVLSVHHDSSHSCSVDFFFGVREASATGVVYRLTVLKKAEPGETVEFNLQTDMSGNYISATDLGDDSRPMFGGIASGGVSGYYDTGMNIGSSQEVPIEICQGEEKPRLITRDASFRFKD